MNGKTAMYILKRIGMAILTVFVVVTITFWFMQLIPGGPFTSEKSVSATTMASLNAKFGLDKPVFVQYLIYVGRSFGFIHDKSAAITSVWTFLDFGPSMKLPGQLVSSIIDRGMTYSFPLGLVAAVLSILLGTFWGSIAAVNRGKSADHIIMVFSTASIAFPSFITATFLLYFFALKLHWFPTDYTNGGFAAFVLPCICLSFYPTAYITRLSRSATLDSLGSDYIITARAKGASKGRILFGHVMKNSLAPTISYAGPMFAGIITGSLVVEQIFQIPGIGSSFINSITSRDYNLIMGTTVFMTDIVVIMTLVSDILYTVVNPRVSLE
jgi:oligopeptide transport system permease protein